MNGYFKKRKVICCDCYRIKSVFFAKAEDRVFKNEGTFFYKLKQKF